MKDEHIFIDTNILFYAHDAEAGKKHILAKELISELWSRALAPAISVQVLQELCVNLLRKKITATIVEAIISDYMEWEVIQNTDTLVLGALREQSRWKLSFWDSLIISAAREARVSQIWSEDLNHNQNYGGLVVVNPLAK